MRDLVRCPGAEHKWIERKDLSFPTRLSFLCHCGGVAGYGLDHRCDWTAHDPDERPCEECERFRNCTCTRVACPECRYVLDVDEQEHFYAANLMVCPQCASRDLREVTKS